MIEINGWLLLTQAATFLAAMVIVWKLFWGPLTRFMRERSERMAADLQRASDGRREIESLEAEYRLKLSELEQQTQQTLREAMAKGSQARDAIVQEARDEAGRLLAKAKTDLELERSRVMQELRGQVTELSLAVLERLLGQGLDEKLQRQLLSQFNQDLERVRPLS